MEIYTLTELQYAEPEKNASYCLYIYGRDGMHSGRRYFRNRPQFPDEEITTEQAKNRAKAAIAQKKEVRITDGGDNLVFHAANGAILYPEEPEEFWEKL